MEPSSGKHALSAGEKGARCRSVQYKCLCSLNWSLIHNARTTLLENEWSDLMWNMNHKYNENVNRQLKKNKYFKQDWFFCDFFFLGWPSVV